MKGTIYKELSNRHISVAISPNQTVAEAFPAVDFDNAVVIVNGKKATRDHFLVESDIVTIRQLPSASTTVAMVVMGVVAVAAGIIGGVALYKSKEAAENAQKEIDKMKRMTGNAEIDNRPFIRGASNTVATGNSQPYIIGRHLFTPYLLQSPFYEIEGVDGCEQYINLALDCGFNRQILQKISIDETDIKTFSDVTPQQGAFGIDSGVFAEDGRIEIIQDGSLFSELDKLNNKTISVQSNAEIPRTEKVENNEAEHLTFTLDEHAMSVDVAITFPHGLYAYNDSGTRGKTKVTITPEYSLDGGQTWKSANFGFGNYLQEVGKSTVYVNKQKHSLTNSFSDHFFQPSDGKQYAYNEDAIWIYDDSLTRREEAERAANEWLALPKDEIKTLNNSLSDTSFDYEITRYKNAVKKYGEISQLGIHKKFIFIEYELETQKYKITSTTLFDRNETKELRYVAHHDFTARDYYGDEDSLKASGSKNILVRIRNSGKSDSKIKNDCYCLFYQTTCFDPEESTQESLAACKIVNDRERSYCTMLGLRIKASANNEDKLKKINVLTQGIARTWNGERWSEEKKATRNPAAWALEILTSDRHSASRFSDDEIDLEGFGDLYDWCESEEYGNSFKFDHVITNGAKKSDTLNLIMDSIGAVIYWDMLGRLAVAMDCPRENAIAVYNPQNIISVTNKKIFSRTTDGIRIKYITSENDAYKEEIYLQMREGKTLGPDSMIKDITVTGVTTHAHIVKYARRVLALEILRPKTTTIEVGNEGVFFTPYSKILLQDDSLKIGLGSATIKSVEWWGGLLRRITLNEPVEFSNRACGVIVNCFSENGMTPLPIKVEGSGLTDTLEIDVFKEQIRQSADVVPEAGNILSFGELDIDGNFTRITTEHLISGISRSGSGYRLELVNYNPAVYESGAIPPYKSNMTKRPASPAPSIPSDVPTRAEVEDAIANIETNSDAANELAALVTHGITFSHARHIKDVFSDELRQSVNLDYLVEKIDEAFRTAANGIESTEERITLSVEDVEKQARTMFKLTSESIEAVAEKQTEDGRKIASLEMTAESLRAAVFDVDGSFSLLSQTVGEIRQTVVDNAAQTEADFAVMSDAIMAQVVGAGSAGRMALSLELPAMVKKADLDSWVAKTASNQASEKITAAELYGKNGIYAKLADRINGTDLYAVRGDASQSAIQSLWNKMRKVGLLASQFSVEANQISFAGMTVFSSRKTEELANAAQAAAQAAAAQDATTKANAAQSAAAQDATTKANAAQNAAAQDATTKANAAVTNALIQLVGAGNVRDQTIIEGGKIKTGLIDVDALTARIAEIQQIITGSIESNNYQQGISGFKIDGETGNVEFNGKGEIGKKMKVKGIIDTAGINLTLTYDPQNEEHLVSIRDDHYYGNIGNSKTNKIVTFPLSGTLKMKARSDFGTNQYFIMYKNGDYPAIAYHTFTASDEVYETIIDFNAGDCLTVSATGRFIFDFYCSNKNNLARGMMIMGVYDADHVTYS